MKNNIDSQILTNLNLFNLDIDFDMIYQDFDIWTIKQKYKNYASYSDMDTIIGFDKILAVFKPYNGRIWILLKKNIQNLKESVDSDLYDVEKIPKEEFVKYPKSKVNVVNLLLNSLPKYIEKAGYARRFGDNVAGGLYIFNSKTLSKLSKNLPNYIQAYHIKFENSTLEIDDEYNQLVFSVEERTACKLSYLKKILSPKELQKTRKYNKLKLDPKARALMVSKPDDKDAYIFYGSSKITYDKPKRTEHVSIGVGEEKYYKSRSAVYESAYGYIQEYLGKYLNITQENKLAYRKEVSNRKTSKQYLDSKVKNKTKIYFVNKSSGHIDKSLPYNDLFEFVDEVKPKQLNIVCVNKKDSYKDNNQEDSYERFNYLSTEVRQHIYHENLLGKEDEIITRLSACVRDTLFKNDILQRKITVFDYTKLGLNEPFKILMLGKTKDKDAVIEACSMIIFPDGSLEFFEMDNSLNYKVIEKLYKQGCRYIFRYKDDVNFLKESNVSSLHEIDNYSENVVKKYERNKYPEGYLVKNLLEIILGFDDIGDFYTRFFNYIYENLNIPPLTDKYDLSHGDDTDGFYYQLASNILATDNLADITKKSFEKFLLKGLYSKSRDKHKNLKNALESSDIHIEDKSKSKYQELNSEGFDIHYFEYFNKDGNKTLGYKVGQSAGGNKEFKLANKAKIWLLEAENSSAIMEFLLDTLDVDFVGSGKPMVHPFFCKYLKEAVAALKDWSDN
ncbi:hypothetical protein [Francisella tularensis]|uniref:hypothetical protein n=1 Tax=Francisella tularensis TaxID=263 RepID=UPI001C0F0082|nr:hypothetical protein [Francisella tularensis]MBK2110168.1 hypothetical protein [Francisella tularensis subsp. novicida FSC595]